MMELAHPDVKYISANQIMTIYQTTICDTAQNTPPWGLGRLQSGTIKADVGSDPALAVLPYYYGSTGGQGVTSYIIDTGIRPTHSDFGGRAQCLFDATTTPTRNTCNDGNGHGTHVAGTIGGNIYGVAKGTALVGVQVLSASGSGTNAGVIAGINWVAANAKKPATANLSLGGGVSTAVDEAINALSDSGVTTVVAAGNSAANACNYSPARATKCITVGATTSSDMYASYTNHGRCVNIIAPGTGVKSAWYTSDTATNTISGTSMASPHVAGAAALVLGLNPGFTPEQVANYLQTISPDVVLSGTKLADTTTKMVQTACA